MVVGKPRLTKVTIDGVDVTSFLIRWNQTSLVSQNMQGIEITLSRSVYNSVPNLETSPRALTIKVERGVTTSTEDIIFQGEIVERQTIANQVLIKGNDKLYQAVKKNITKTFDSSVDTEAGVISEIFKTLLDEASLSHDSSSITASGSTIIAKTFICNNADVFERLNLLAELLDWQFFYNASDDLVYFQPQGARSGTNTLTVGSNVINRPRWIRDGKKVVSKAKIFGGPIETATQETFSGDDNETVFTLASIPVNVSITIGGTLQTGGIEDQAGTDVNYFVDNPNKKITFVIAPTTGVNNIVIDYTFLSPIAIQGESAASNALETTMRKPDLTTVPDVNNFINNFLLKHGSDFLKTGLAVTNVTDMNVNQTVTVVDSNESINQDFLITKIVRKFPYRFDEIQVDSEALQIEDWNITVDDRLRRIEERLVQEESIVIILKSFNRTQFFKIGRRYFKLEKRDIRDGGGEYSFVLGHPDGGVLGTNLLGDRRQAATLQVLQQGVDLYLETFEDTDFNDSSTATWSTTGSVTFTSGEVATSSTIDFNNGTITTAKLTSTEESGSFTYEMTADGSNWETVTSGTAHTFTNTGTDLRWRATENAASTGEISKIVVEDYH